MGGRKKHASEPLESSSQPETSIEHSEDENWKNNLNSENFIDSENIKADIEIDEIDFQEETKVFGIDGLFPKQFVKKEILDDEDNLQEKACDSCVFDPEIKQSIKIEQEEYIVKQDEHQNTIEDCRLDIDFSVKQENQIFEDSSSIAVRKEPELETSQRENIENTKCILEQTDPNKCDLNSILKEENETFEEIFIKNEFELETSQLEEYKKNQSYMEQEHQDRTDNNECTTNTSTEEEEQKQISSDAGTSEKRLSFAELLKLENVHKCLDCDFRTSRRYDLQKHRVKFHSEPDLKIRRRQKCDLCDYTTTNVKCLKRHFENRHFEIKGLLSRSDFQKKKPVKSKDCVKTFSCEICSFKCEYNQKLRHLATHRIRHPPKEI